MSRIVETQNVTLRSEAVAPKITINWNPVDDTGAIIFKVQRMESVDGVFQRLVNENDLFMSMADFIGRPVQVGDQLVSPLLIVGYIKQLFDDLYAERANAQAIE